MVTNGNLHYVIIKYIIDNGFAPEIDTLARLLGKENDEIEGGLIALQEYHGVVLHPNKRDIWVIHPFSLAPTNFLVKSAKGTWWGNCAWCSLGIAALLQEDATITTRVGAHDKQIDIHIHDGKVIEHNLFIHFPIPMKKAWDNVIYTCSTMLVFETPAQVDQWSRIHNIPKGDVQTVSTIWEFSKKWYGNHLNPEWKKWTLAEARTMFRHFKLTGDIWDLDPSGTRF